MQNKSNIYTINDAPPSYAEATGALASDTQNPQLDQRYPHTTIHPVPSEPFPYPYSPNYQNLDRIPVQSSYQYESTEHQNQSTEVTYNRTIITRTNTRDYKSCTRFFRLVWILAVLASVGALISLILRAIR
ncbi:PREDICTED: uncharacterized protein LOC105151154 [Acromyrmex echinatior]|uniref:uncharacterized protein LOC105151154 n=1 Tax=Acromyrmex echinatior TaxID=103372 RepID=UPI000580EA5B|nr:PREDICTED: uncharacterized protein LOC105151154 [Acromyrmex echinatior]